jgi:hypothetical protein
MVILQAAAEAAAELMEVEISQAQEELVEVDGAGIVLLEAQFQELLIQAEVEVELQEVAQAEEQEDLE